MKPSDFKDVDTFDKAKATHYYLYEIAYNEQKPVRSTVFMSASKAFAHALQNSYCITLIECPFDFNFEAMLNHFAWCCQFMFFNFSDTTIQFDILNKIRERGTNRDETLILLKILEQYPEPYSYTLDTYEGEAKFALMKRHRMNESGELPEFLNRDKHFRSILQEALKNLHGIGKTDHNPYPDTPRKYEVSAYGYLRFSDELSFDQQEQIIQFLYDTLKALFRLDYSFEYFHHLFSNENSKPIELNISVQNSRYLDAQKLHLLFRKLKERILIASWDIIKKKIIVFNQAGELVNSVYQISRAKISADKSRQINKLLQPVLELLPGLPQ